MEVLRTAILDMLRRKKQQSFYASEVVKQMFPEDWEHFLEDVNEAALELHRNGLISIQGAETELKASNSLKISSPNKL